MSRPAGRARRVSRRRAGWRREAGGKCATNSSWHLRRIPLSFWMDMGRRLCTWYMARTVEVVEGIASHYAHRVREIVIMS